MKESYQTIKEKRAAEFKKSISKENICSKNVDIQKQT
jgi:hypothetical protein